MGCAPLRDVNVTVNSPALKTGGRCRTPGTPRRAAGSAQMTRSCSICIAASAGRPLSLGGFVPRSMSSPDEYRCAPPDTWPFSTAAGTGEEGAAPVFGPRPPTDAAAPPRPSEAHRPDS